MKIPSSISILKKIRYLHELNDVMSEIFYQKHLLSVQIFNNKIINTQIDHYQIQKKSSKLKRVQPTTWNMKRV